MKKPYLLLLGMLITSLAFSQTTKVQIIHNSADTAARFVDIYADTIKILDNVEFRTASPLLDIDADVDIDISILDSASSDTIGALFRTTVNLDSTEYHLVVASGIVSSTGYTPNEAFNLEVFSGLRDTSSSPTTTDVLVFHGSTDAGPVDVVETSIPAGTLVDNLEYADFAGYLSLATSDYEIQVRDSLNSKIYVAYSAPLSTLGAGGLGITVLASGFADSSLNSNGTSFGLFAVTPLGGAFIELDEIEIPVAEVQVIHNSADTAARFVDVWLNDELLLDDFEFRTATPFVELDAGIDFDISIADSSSTDTSTALAQYTFNLMEDSSYILIANGIVSPTGYSPNEPFDLEVFVGARDTSSSPTSTDVLVFHGSTDAGPVDVVETSVPAGILIDDLEYIDFAGYLSLVTADYEIQVQDTANSEIIASYSAPLSTLGTGGLGLTVLASGFLDSTINSNGSEFGLFVVSPLGGDFIPLPLIETPSASVQVIHNSADTAARFVDVWLNDELLLDDFEFRTATPFVELDAGIDFDISIADSSSSDTSTALAKYTFNLMEDSSYIIVANGIVSATGYTPNEPFDLEVFEGARDTAMISGNTDILVFHGATDAPAVDVEEDQNNTLLVDSLSYADFSDYIEVPTANYDLDLINATNGSSIQKYLAPLSTLSLSDQSITVVASGFVDPLNNSNGATFGLWVATRDGGAMIPLSILTGLDESRLKQLDVQVYPNPTRGILNLDGDELNGSELVTIFDINGAEIKTTNTSSRVLDIQDLPPGIYFLRILGVDMQAIKRIVKQ